MEITLLFDLFMSMEMESAEGGVKTMTSTDSATQLPWWAAAERDNEKL